MYFDGKIWIGLDGDEKICIEPTMANRHGLIAGATGTGKTITLKVMAESFSEAGVPVFLSDVKGDLAGMCTAGVDSEDMQSRIKSFGLDQAGFKYKAYPTTFWDISGQYGLPIRTTISEFGPLLLAKLLDLNQTQTDILSIIFRIADDHEDPVAKLLLDLKDLKATISRISENTKDYKSEYGNLSTQSLNTILRSILAFEEKGSDDLFGEPALDIHDFFIVDENGRGMINILDSRELIHNGAKYSTFMLWLLAELFEVMPEVGDVEKPKMVFFFDEAHLLFDDAPKALLEKIEQVVKLIRSKGIGIYFVTQNPKDVPDSVLAQLGNKVQHALRAYTPKEQKALRAAAESFRENPDFDTQEVLQVLGTGEALVSFLQKDGIPAMVRRARILPPQSKMGSIDDATRANMVSLNILHGKYNYEVDRDSAYEFWQRIIAAEESVAEKTATKKSSGRKKTSEVERTARQVASSATGTIGRHIGNTVGKSVGGSLGKTLGGNIGANLGRGVGRGIFSTIIKNIFN